MAYTEIIQRCKGEHQEVKCILTLEALYYTKAPIFVQFESKHMSIWLFWALQREDRL